MQETIRKLSAELKLPQEVIDFYKEKGIYEQITSTDKKEKTFALVDEILKKAKHDVEIALFINPDRVKIIKQHAEEAISEKFEKEDSNEQLD